MPLNTSLKALLPESTTAPPALPFARRWPSTVPGSSASSSGAAWLTRACVVVDASVVVGVLALFPPHPASATTAASAPAAATRRARLPGPACAAFDLVRGAFYFVEVRNEERLHLVVRRLERDERRSVRGQLVVLRPR